MADDNKIIAEIIVEGVETFKQRIGEALGYTGDLNDLLDKLRKQPGISPETSNNVNNFKQQLRQSTTELVALNLQLAEMKDAGKAGTKEFNDLEKKIESLRKKAGELKDAMSDANEQIRSTGSDTAGLDKTIRVISSASAAFQVFEGATVLAGKSNEDLQKALLKLNAVMAITQGLQQIQNELVRGDSVFKGIATKATLAYNFVIGKSTGVLKAFRFALAATGIGAFIILIGGLISEWKSIANWIGITENNLNKFKDSISGTINAGKTFFTEIGGIIKNIFKGNFGEAIDSAKGLGKKVGESYTKGVEESITVRALTNAIGKLNFYSEIFTARGQDLKAAKSKLNAAIIELALEGKKVFGDSFKISDELINDSKSEKLKEAYKNYVAAEKEYIDTIKQLREKELEKQLTERQTRQEFNISIHQRELELIKERQKEEEEAKKRRIASNLDFFAKLEERWEKHKNDILKKEQKITDAVRKRNAAEQQTANENTREQILQAQFEKAQAYYTEIQAVITQTSQLISNATQIRAENEIAALDRKRQRGLISEKQYEKEVAKIKNDAAQKQRRAEVINAFAMIPMAVLSAFTNTQGGIVAKGIAAGIAGAFALAQASLVAAAPLPKFRDGGSVAKRLGLIKGKSHEAGGVPIEVEGDEFVMSKKAVKHYGVDFMDKVNNMKLSPVVTMSPKLEQMKQTDYKLYEHLATLGGYMKQDYRTNERALNVLAEINQGVRAGRKRYV